MFSFGSTFDKSNMFSDEDDGGDDEDLMAELGDILGEDDDDMLAEIAVSLILPKPDCCETWNILILHGLLLRSTFFIRI